MVSVRESSLAASSVIAELETRASFFAREVSTFPSIGLFDVSRLPTRFASHSLGTNSSTIGSLVVSFSNACRELIYYFRLKITTEIRWSLDFLFTWMPIVASERAMFKFVGPWWSFSHYREDDGTKLWTKSSRGSMEVVRESTTGTRKRQGIEMSIGVSSDWVTRASGLRTTDDSR